MHMHDEEQEAQEALDLLLKAEVKYRDDIRFRHLRDLAVSIAIKTMRYDDPRADPIRDRYELADRTATLMLAMIYDQDAEISALKAETAHYKKLTLDIVSRAPIPVSQLLNPKPTSPQTHD